MAAKIPILTFHDIDNPPREISIPPDIFERGVETLHSKGYRTIGLSDVVKCMQDNGSFPERSMVITFDDGYLSVYRNAFPVLRRYGMTATVFLTVGPMAPAKPSLRLPSLEGRIMLDRNEIRRMARSGFDFGAHTLTHPDLTRVSPEQAHGEILRSKTIVEQMSGFPAASFAYPYGHFNQTVYEIVRKHFSCACAAKLGLVDAAGDRFALPRVEMYYFRTDRLFHILTTRLFRLYLRVRDIPRQSRPLFQKGIRP